MVRNILPPGFRFHPTDVELVQYYLRRKVMNKTLLLDAIAVVDIYKLSPWDLPGKSCLKSRDLEWYFFCPRDRKYANGPRTNRATETGYWKTTGKDRSVSHKARIVGMKKTLVFHTGRAPKGARTDWVMHEYRLEDKEVADAGFLLDAYVLCRIFEKSGPGPKNGEQYGAPFDEEEWDEDEDEAEAENLNHGQPTLCPAPDDLYSPSVPNHIEVGSSSHAPLFNDGSNQTVFHDSNPSVAPAVEQESSFLEGCGLEELLMEITDHLDGVPPPLGQNIPTTETTSYQGEGSVMYERSSAFQGGSEIYEGLGEIAPHEGRLYSSICHLDDPESYGYMEASDFMPSGQTDQTQFEMSTMFYSHEGLDVARLSDFEGTFGEGYSHSEFDQNGASSITPQEVDFENELQSLHRIPSEDKR